MGFVIDIADPTAVSGFSAGYQQAINTAINFYETHITTNITVSIDFELGTLGANTVGQSNTTYFGYTYSQLYNQIQAVDAAPAASSVQQAAAAALRTNFPTDPTNGGQFWIGAADASALGLSTGGYSGTDGTVTLGSNVNYTWSQSGGIASGTFDGVGTVEHEISEVLGRTAFLGAERPDLIGGAATQLPTYNILDMFHYAASGNPAGIVAPGSAAGPLEEPFVAGYDASAQTYFSFDGASVTLPFGSQSEIAPGDDIADWNSSVVGDSFGFAQTGTVDSVSITDLDTLNVLGYSESTACYCAGTLILTERGEVAVEDLRVGETVVTASGEARPIVWIGTRMIDITKHRFPQEVFPVRVRAGAFGDDLPRRDLLLSPQHAVYVDRVLIPIILLANGATIVQEQADKITYWHVELQSHDILLAEGLPAESFLDCGSRTGFSNCGAFVELHPTFSPQSWADACAPLRESGKEVAEVSRRLLERAEMLGFQRANDPDLHILADVVRVDPERGEDGIYRFALPAGAENIRLVSRIWRPADGTSGEGGDCRHLGVPVTRIDLDGRPQDIGSFGKGWHEPEGEADRVWRWTDGFALLPAGARNIAVRIGEAPLYWVAGGGFSSELSRDAA